MEKHGNPEKILMFLQNHIQLYAERQKCKILTFTHARMIEVPYRMESCLKKAFVKNKNEQR